MVLKAEGLLHQVSLVQLSQLQMLPMEGKRDNFNYGVS